MSLKRVFALALVVSSLTASAANDICLPSTLWMLSDVQNDIFVQPMIRRWRPYDDFVRFSCEDGKISFSRRLSRVVSITNCVDGAVLKVDLVNGDEFETVKTLKSVLRVGKKGVGAKDVYAQIIGDSYTHGAFFKSALLESGYVPKLHLVGLRTCAEGQCDEGRGGWAMEQYFTVPRTEHLAYHGFLHPQDGRYWGDARFWKMAWRCVRKTQPKGFEPSYSCSRFDDCVVRFDETTGLLLDPVAGDYQIEDETRRMVRFDGEAWQSVDEKMLTWQFDYGKYLDMWRIPPPQFVFVLLGLNDFRHDLKADFTEWGRRVAIMKDAYLKVCPQGKFVICIPCSTCGPIDNAVGDFTPYQDAAMWRFRDWLIRTFDRREDEGFYLLDSGICIDAENGYCFETGPQTMPHENCSNGVYRVYRGTPHPYFSYPSMGIPLAAFIQYYRP